MGTLSSSTDRAFPFCHIKYHHRHHQIRTLKMIVTHFELFLTMSMMATLKEIN
jgi:hypothetical protein